MGRTNYTAFGYGMTERDAWNQAIEEDRQYNGHQEGYSGTISSSTGEDDKSKCLVKPKPAKVCTVDKPVRKGARKWKTVYRLYYDSSNGSRHNDEANSQGEAIKLAKKIAIERNGSVRILIEKVLEGSELSKNLIADVAPKKSAMGRWQFTGTARE